MKNTTGDFEDVTPQEILDFACELEKIKNQLNSPDSVVNRTIYARISYAVFIFLREWLKKFAGYVSNYGDHTKIPNFIKSYGPFDRTKNRQLSNDLIHLKKLRHQADYRITVPSQFDDEYKNWYFTSIPSAFKMAEDIIKAFNNHHRL